jgi:hypothetical protein
MMTSLPIFPDDIWRCIFTFLDVFKLQLYVAHGTTLPILCGIFSPYRKSHSKKKVPFLPLTIVFTRLAMSTPTFAQKTWPMVESIGKIDQLTYRLRGRSDGLGRVIEPARGNPSEILRHLAEDRGMVNLRKFIVNTTAFTVSNDVLKLIEKFQKLQVLAIYPGHGDVGPSLVPVLNKLAANLTKLHLEVSSKGMESRHEAILKMTQLVSLKLCPSGGPFPPATYTRN